MNFLNFGFSSCCSYFGFSSCCSQTALPVGLSTKRLNPYKLEEQEICTDFDYIERKGNLIEGKLNGPGIKEISLEGRVIVIEKGMFKHDQLDGEGTIEWIAKQMYKGQFQNGLLSGQGNVTYIDGTVCWNNFQNGCAI